MKQPQFQPMPVEYQVIIIYAVTNKYLLDVPVSEITRFEREFFEFLDTKYHEVPDNIAEEKVISEATETKLKKAIEEFKTVFLAKSDEQAPKEQVPEEQEQTPEEQEQPKEQAEE